MISILLSFYITAIVQINPTNNNHVKVDSLVYDYQKNKDWDMDFLDAYQLTIDKAFLFGNYSTFINKIGVPKTVTITNSDFDIKSKNDLEKIIATAKAPTIVTLHYQGIDMWYAYDDYIIPSTIDFRKTNKSISYGKTIFDTTYTIEQFKKQFPKSANPSFALPQSFFEMTTKEKGGNLEHYILLRKTKDDPNATPMIEFTFNNGKLIFILFANF